MNYHVISSYSYRVIRQKAIKEIKSLYFEVVAEDEKLKASLNGGIRVSKDILETCESEEDSDRV